jgi:hypothetical protein
MAIFSTTGSKLYVGPPQAVDLTIAEYEALATGSQAAGSITFSANPADTSTITIDGTVVTFVAASPIGNEVLIAGTLADTLVALADFLNASIDTNLSKMSYAADPGGTKLLITALIEGSAGNAYTIVAGTSPAASHGTVSAATLAGGGGEAWIPIGEVESLGDFGDTAANIAFTSIEDGRVRKMKGARDAGNMALVCGMDMRDVGQIALVNGQKTAFYYAFKLVASDKRLPTDTPTIYYWNALVESAKTNFGASNNVPKTTFTLGINTAILDIPSAA